MGALVCVDPLAVGQSIAKRIADSAGLTAVGFDNEDDALDYLRGDAPVSIIIVASSLISGDGISLLQGVRLLRQRMNVPIAYVVADDSTARAGDALLAGATEVLRRNEVSALEELVGRHIEVAKAASAAHGRMLLVEDTPTISALISELANALGLEVRSCFTYAEAVTALDDRYDVIVVDIVLDGRHSGVNLLRELRKRENGARRTPVLVMSGYHDPARRIDALRSGADEFVSKPFEPEEFIWRLRRLLEISALRQASAVMPGDSESAHARSTLTGREMEIYKALRTGAGDKQIAADLGISFWTVRTHIQSIFNKLGVMNRRELMVPQNGVDDLSR